MLQRNTNSTPQMYLNTGTLYDLATGRFMPGKDGSFILNGGLSRINSFAGKKQTFKTTIAAGLSGRVLRNYPFIEELFYDTENSLNGEERLAALAGCQTPEETNDFCNRVEYKCLDDYYLEDFYNRILEIANYREKHKKDFIEETPFLDRHGKNILAWVPAVVSCDSFSAALVRTVGELVDKQGISGKKTTTDNMKDGLVKTRFFIQMPSIASRAGIVFVFTGHLGKDGGMSPMDAFKRELPMMGMNEKVKNVGTKFGFLSNNMLETRAVKLLKDGNKECLYPADVNSDVELQQIKSIICRCKNNASGSAIHHISSQFYGMQEYLEYFHYVKERSAIVGTSGRYKLPGLNTKFNRKQIRSKIDESYEFKRMLEILGQYLYIHRNWNMPEFKLIAPDEFAEILDKSSSALISDILNSTGIWSFTGSKVDRPYLSIIDIVNKIMKDK